MEGTCPRCGSTTGESRWCPTCGKELTGRLALPTPEAAAAAHRETAWLEAHPDVAEAEWRSGEEQRVHGPTVPPQPWIDPPIDPTGRARTARRLLVAQAILAVPVVILEAVYLSVLAGATEFEWETSDRIINWGVAVGIGYLLQFVLLLVTAGFFIAWLHRVHKNARGLGSSDMRFGDGWAIGGWFVPILSLWRPKQIVNDAWRASDPELGAYTHRHEWEKRPVPGVFLAWWLLFNVYSAVSNGVGNAAWDANSLDADRAATIASMGSSPFLIASALLGARVVSMVTDRQNARAAARERMTLPVPAGQV